MSSVIKYLKRKIKPFRKCIGSPTHSFGSPSTPSQSSGLEYKKSDICESPSAIAQYRLDNLINKCLDDKCHDNNKTIIKKLSNKRRFNLRLKKNIKSNIAEFITDSSSNHRRLPSSHSRIDQSDKSLNDNGSSLHTPMLSSSSLSSYSDQSHPRNLYTDSNFGGNTVDAEFINSTRSAFHHCNNTTAYDAGADTYFILDACPTNNDDTAASMVTYNTKYAGHDLSSNEEEIHDDEANRSVLCSDISDQQQSTPYTENLAKIRTLKNDATAVVSKNHLNSAGKRFRKSNTVNIAMTIKQQEAENDNELNDEPQLKKCRRSNTTYTISNAADSTAVQSNNKIIDYFTKIQFNRPVKKKANIRRLNILEEIKNNNERRSIEKKLNDSNEIEKLQDAFFNDSVISNDSFLTTKTSISNTNLHKNNHNNHLYSDDDSLGRSQIKESSLSSSSSSKLPPHLNLTPISDCKTNLINCSIEKIRRSTSYPGLNQNTTTNSVVFENLSKITNIKEANEECENEKSSEQNDSNYQKGESSINESASLPTGGFIRNEPTTRLSKNIKQMFKNVVKYQMNALNTLENFYESQVVQLESDRASSLSQCPDEASKQRINAYFDEQLRSLEERVQSNLRFICDNKSNRLSQTGVVLTSGNSSSNLSANQSKIELDAKKALSRKISQLVLLKQLQQQPVIVKGLGSKALNNLKTNLISQNGLLPSKNFTFNSSNVDRVRQIKANRFESEFENENESDFSFYNTNPVFKRHLSLPFQQIQRKNVVNMRVNENQNKSSHVNRAKSPHIASLVYSSTRGRQNSVNTPESNNSLTNTLDFSIKSNTLRTSQYQKNYAKKNASLSSSTVSNDALNVAHEEEFENDCTYDNESLEAKMKRQMDNEVFRQSNEINDFNLRSHNFHPYNHYNARHVAPRLSDGHIQYKLNQMRMAAQNRSLFNSQSSLQINANLPNELLMQRLNTNFVIETQV